MKFGLILSLLLLSGLASAQPLKEKKIKEEMLERVEKLISLIEITREDLDRADVAGACKKVNELFVLYPEHLKSILGHMNLFSSRVVDAKEESLAQLIELHRQSNICAKGVGHEYVDPKSLSKLLKGIRKSLKRQRRTIKKEDTDYENTYYYEYEFNG